MGMEALNKVMAVGRPSRRGYGRYSAGACASPAGLLGMGDHGDRVPVLAVQHQSLEFSGAQPEHNQAVPGHQIVGPKPMAGLDAGPQLCDL